MRIRYLLLIALLCVVAFPFYDGYWNRSIPEDELVAAVSFELKEETGANRNEFAFFARNEGAWIFESAELSVFVKKSKDFKVPNRDGLSVKTFTYDIYPLKSMNDHELTQLNESAALALDLSIPENALNSIEHDKDFVAWGISFTSARGRRRPLNLVKQPIDFVHHLFSRSGGETEQTSR